ncbi:MAG: histidine--tRNA ligase [Bdellovibrionota bacterium]
MTLGKLPYKGTRDLFPNEKRVQNYLFEKMHTTAQLFGYEPYDGPLLEEVDLYRAKSGEELVNEQIYSFTDRGGREVAIRPEMTPTLARMVAQINREAPKPIRWYAIPNLMRYERPQKGRLREHWQFNVDIFGGKENLAEFEIFNLAITLLQSFGANASHFEILINHRKLVDYLFKDKMQLSSETALKLCKLLDRYKKLPEAAFLEQLNLFQLSKEGESLFLEYLKLNSFEQLQQFLDSHHIASTVWDFKAFLLMAKDLQITSYLHYDPTIVRGLDYYTGLVFEIFDKHPDNRRALCGGGAYDRLLEIFGEMSLPGVGFGLGDVTLKDFLQSHGLLPDMSKPKNDLLLTFQIDAGITPTMRLAQSLREQGIRVITTMECLKLNKIFALAEKRGARCVSILDNQELIANKIALKNLNTGKQVTFNLDDISAIMAFILD